MESFQLNWVDYILIALVLISVVGGAIRGLLKEVLPLVSLVLGVLVAYRVSPRLQPRVMEWLDNGAMAYVFCFVVVFAFTWILLGILSGLLYKLVRATAAGPLDKLFGGVLGLIRGIAVAVVIVIALLAFLPPDHDALRGSALAPATLEVGRLAVSLMPEETKEELLRKYEELKEKSKDLRRGSREFHPNTI